MNRITELFQRKGKDILSIFFTAGYPELHSTREIILRLADAGVDMIEIGIPFSDPVADGETIQQSSQVALENGMTLEILMEQLTDIRKEVEIPLLLMGYLNPVMQYGLQRLLADAEKAGIDGFILPDLPMYEYETQYQKLFTQHHLSNVFLVTPQTSPSRIHKIDTLTNGFIYLVSSSSTTGKTHGLSDQQEAYFQRIQTLDLKNPCLIGFGIKDAKSFQQAASYAQGAIIGSAFIKALSHGKPLSEIIPDFVQGIRPTIESSAS